MAALIVEPFNGKLRMLAPMSSRGKLGLSASYLCRVLSLPCSIYHSRQSISGMPAASSKITYNPSPLKSYFFSVLGIIPWAFNGTMPWISIRDHRVSSFSWLVDLLLSLFHLLSLFCLMKDILAKALYISKKRGLSWVRWLFNWCAWKCDW